MFEELAEAYVNSKADGGHFDLEQFGKAYFSESSMKQAFLAGLRAGKDMAKADIATAAYMQGAERYKPKWHKVADGDLPQDCEDGTNASEHVWVRFKSGNTGVCYYDWDLLGWFANGYSEQLKDILVWCEIPKFEE